MTATQKTKMVDKLTLGKKLVALLKKRYQSPVPKQERPVLETLLYAICLEDSSEESAKVAFEKLYSAFHDLNELRVSSISELVHVFDGAPDADWRAHRVKNVLQFVFEKHFEFAFESLRRKTLELATKQLMKIRDLSAFDRNYTLQAMLGIHIVPVDRLMTNACAWLGLAHSGETPEHAAESLRSVVRKADVPVFCHYLRCVAVDPRLVKAFEPGKTSHGESGKNPSTEAHDPQTMIERLIQLCSEADAAARKAKKSPPSRGTIRAEKGTRTQPVSKMSRARDGRDGSRKKK